MPSPPGWCCVWCAATIWGSLPLGAAAGANALTLMPGEVDEEDVKRLAGKWKCTIDSCASNGRFDKSGLMGIL